MKVSRTYRLDEETAARIAEIADKEGFSATDAVTASVQMYFSMKYEQKYEQKYAESAPAEPTAGNSAAVAALVGQLAVKDEQLAKKDEQIAKLMDAVADGQRVVQGAQALHHETAQALALESAEQKKEGRWARLKAAWRG